jgi:hypothetical protein
MSYRNIPKIAEAVVKISLAIPIYEPQITSYVNIQAEIARAKNLVSLGLLLQKLITESTEAIAGNNENMPSQENIEENILHAINISNQ